MTPDERDALQAEVLGERRHLVSLAFRMLGTVAEAEDAVQETYLRWCRLSQAERDAIEVPRAWSTRVATDDEPGQAHALELNLTSQWGIRSCLIGGVGPPVRNAASFVR